jgi:hypothetical protein
MSPTAPSPTLNLVASLLELPIVSAGLQRAQSEGIQWGRRLRLRNPDGDADRLVEQAIQAAMWRTAGTGALAGLGGVLTLPAGGGDLLYFLYAEIELAAAIFTLFGVELEAEQHRPILMAAAMGLGVNELLRLLGSRLGEQAAKKLLVNLSREAAQRLQRLLGEKLSLALAKRSWLGLGRLLPVGGAVVGGGLNALLMRGAGEAMRHTARHYRSFLDETMEVEEVYVLVIKEHPG